MHLELSDEQKQARQTFRAYAQEHIAPRAGAWDRAGLVPPTAIEDLRERGYLGAPLPAELGGGGMEAITYGLLTEEIGRACSSTRSLLTVHDMVGLTVQRWGSARLKESFLPPLAKGELLGALALSEPGVGSDAAAVETRARQQGGEWVLDGTKTWTTFGQIANLFLTFARTEDAGSGGGASRGGASRGGAPGGGQVTAFLVPASSPGLSVRPIHTMVGTRASMLAELTFDGCRIPGEYLIGRVGFGFSHVAHTALDHGRYSVAWGSVGIAQACLDACLAFTGERQQFGVPLAEHPLVRRKLTEMIASVRAARLLCYRAGHLRREGDPDATAETMIAKYFASRTAVAAANDAVQLHGARGLSEDFPIERYLRDAKVTEIIEGSSQIQQLTIPRFPLGDL